MTSALDQVEKGERLAGTLDARREADADAAEQSRAAGAAGGASGDAGGASGGPSGASPSLRGAMRRGISGLTFSRRSSIDPMSAQARSVPDQSRRIPLTISAYSSHDLGVISVQEGLHQRFESWHAELKEIKQTKVGLVVEQQAVQREADALQAELDAINEEKERNQNLIDEGTKELEKMIIDRFVLMHAPMIS